jgi:YVTN family beta-propeller protein
LTAPLLSALLLAVALPIRAEDAYHVAATVPLGAAPGWDYASFDKSSGRVFVTLGDHVAVFDPARQQVLGGIAGLARAHGVAFAPTLGLGFISSGQDDSIVTFDLKTLAVLRTTPAGGSNPDALLFLPESGKLYSFNGKSQDVTVINPADGAVEATILLAGKPEFAAGDTERIYLNLEDIHQLAVIDVASHSVLRTIDLPDCEDPTGLDYDRVHGRVFSVCANGRLVVTATADGRIVANLAIGEGPDAVVFDATRGVLISANGRSGTLSIVRQEDPDHYRLQQTLTTAVKARTLAYDPASGKAWLPVPANAGHFALIEVHAAAH